MISKKKDKQVDGTVFGACEFTRTRGSFFVLEKLVHQKGKKR
jgi:hypothetical protein